MRTLRGQGFQVLATSCSETARPLRAWDFIRPTAVIMGNEHSGVEEELLSLADGQLYIPMYGMIQSFTSPWPRPSFWPKPRASARAPECTIPLG